MEQRIREHLTRLGIDRWSALRGYVTTARDLAAAKGHREAVMTFDFVLRMMDDAEEFEAAATELKRAELAGDIDGMARAMVRLAAME